MMKINVKIRETMMTNGKIWEIGYILQVIVLKIERQDQKLSVSRPQV